MASFYKGLQREAVEHLMAANVRRYLLATGWERVDDLPEHVASEIAIFRRELDGETQEVIVPMNQEQRTHYYRRMAEAVSDIANYENRAPNQVLDDLAAGPADVVQFHVDDPSVTDGTILIEDGLNLFGGAKKALLAAACSVVEPLAFYPRLRRSDASDFIKACRITSDSGSFIARVICPLDAVTIQPDDPQMSLDELDDADDELAVPFTRRVTTTLMRALNALVRSTDQDIAQQLLEHPTANHLSANLCDGLLEMQPSGRTSSLTVGTHWASTSRPQTEVPSQVALRTEHFAVVERLANELRPTRPPEESSFVGTVEELAGSPGADGRPRGQVTLELQEAGDLLTARVNLDANDYKRAADAHLTSRHVKIWGILRRRARIHKITRYERFEILDESNDTSSVE